MRIRLCISHCCHGKQKQCDNIHVFVGRSQFGKLGKMIADHQRLKEHSRFLFIPGPDDIGDLKYFSDFCDTFAITIMLE